MYSVTVASPSGRGARFWAGCPLFWMRVAVPAFAGLSYQLIGDAGQPLAGAAAALP